MQGVPTDEDTIARFRAEYIHSRNASAAGRKVGIEESTARRIARRLEESGDFVEDARRIRATYLDRLTAMRMRIAEVAAERYEEDLPVPENIEKGAMVTIVDKRAEHGKLVLEAEKNAQGIAKFEAEAERGKEDDKPVEVHVHLKPKDDGSGK